MNVVVTKVIRTRRKIKTIIHDLLEELTVKLIEVNQPLMDFHVNSSYLNPPTKDYKQNLHDHLISNENLNCFDVIGRSPRSY